MAKAAVDSYLLRGMSCWSIVPDVMSFLLPAQSHHLAPGGASIVETLSVIKLHMAETLEAFKSVFKRLSFLEPDKFSPGP